MTHYETIEAFPYASLLEVHLETGRTHQIRVHMAAQRHPCAGDAMYGADPTLSARLGSSGSGCTRRSSRFTHPGTGSGRPSSPSTRPTSRTPSSCSRRLNARASPSSVVGRPVDCDTPTNTAGEELR